jgi:hypothetical protein
MESMNMGPDPKLISNYQVDSVSSSFYFFSNMFTKCAVIYLFLRLAQAHSRWARWYLRFLLGFSVVYNLFGGLVWLYQKPFVPFVLTFSFGAGCKGVIRLWLACKPIAALWDVSLQASATCIDRHTVFAVLAAINVVVDTMLVVSPLGMFGTLTLPFRQKAAVMALLMTVSPLFLSKALSQVSVAKTKGRVDC